MKTTILFLYFSALLQGADAPPDVNAEQVAYLKATIAYQGATARQANFWKDVAAAQAEIEQAIAKAQADAQAAIAAAQRKCAEKKMALDQGQFRDTSTLACVDVPAEAKK